MSYYVVAFVCQVQNFLKEMLVGEALGRDGLVMPVVVEEGDDQRSIEPSVFAYACVCHSSLSGLKRGRRRSSHSSIQGQERYLRSRAKSRWRLSTCLQRG